MKHIFSLLFAALLLSGMSQAQDTLRVMQYNILKYGVSESGCTATPTATKNQFLRDIIGGAQPDILGINEMGNNTLYADNILINALRQLDPDWERTTFTNTAGSNITNHLFYNGAKLALYDEEVITHNLRDINYYCLYYLDPGLASGADTAFLHIIIVHLKAGSTTQDQSDRNSQATTILSWLNNRNFKGNLLVMGDFNLKTSSESAYQSFTTNANLDIRLLDPINSPGNWNGSATFDAIHTQSTRSSTLADCGSSGGMDDRFDFIMANRDIMGDSDRVKYVSGTYKAYGNDGNHFNLSINSPANSAVSSTIANSLYSMSDHLPVLLDLAFDVSPVASQNKPRAVQPLVAWPNPFSEQISIEMPSRYSGTLTATDLSGRVLLAMPVSGNSEIEINTSAWGAGMYLLTLLLEDGSVAVTKLIK